LGIAVAELPEGVPVLGRFGDEGVVLVRQGATVRAVSSVCSHYSGPMGEGLVVGDTVRCPWHHASFSLDTGEAVGPPALSPIGCFEVEVAEGVARITGRRQEARRAPATGHAAGDLRLVVIVGGGAAGAAAAEMLRREGFRGDVVLVCGEADVPVDRPNLSKDYLAGTAPEAWMPLRTREAWSELGVYLRLGQRVRTAALSNRVVELASGERLTWDRLILATGADPVRLPIPGAQRPNVFTLRSWADSRAIIAAASTARRVVVVGASFIGLEVAASLVAKGLEVHVVAPDERPLQRVLGPALGAFVQSLHETKGVRFHLGLTPEELDAGGVRLSNGARLAADLVVMGVGVRPSVELAQGLGLKLDRGVVVNEFLETSAPGVYAAGDVARYPDARFGGAVRVEHWQVAMAQGQTAARNALGHQVPFRTVPFFWSQHYEVPINYVGHAEAWDVLDVAGSINGRDAAVAFRQGGRTLAVATVFRDGVSLEAEAAFERGDEGALRRLVPPG
jgi:NADPH-dependent 2,4-dienoyl-CoA reductase/sulfur reductase-like enzyme/nitrite reductase/ring-hydroxylating ferredoxin subunit